jgi:hypothetical protein
MIRETSPELGRELTEADRSRAGSAAVIRRWRRCGIDCLALMAIVFLFTSIGFSQRKPATPPVTPVPDDFKKYPGLLAEFGQLQTKLQQEVQFPPERSQSRLLPLLPEGTIFYAAFPNYGDALHQAVTIFRQQREQSPVLRDWWQHGTLAANGSQTEEYLEKIYQLSQYLGDEIVISGAMGGHKDPSLLILAELRKPGLKDFLEQMAKELAAKSSTPIRVLDVQGLAAAKGTPAGQGLVILVRPDYLVGALDVAALRRFNDQLDKGSREFASTAFGQRLTQAYDGGATVVGAIDLQKLIAQLPPDWDKNHTLERTGFSNAKFLVWEHKDVAGQSASQMELNFTGPRRGVASWLAAPGPLGSLDFVSPKAVMAGAMLLKHPAEIFDDISDLTTASNPNGMAALVQMQKAFNVSLKGDLLSRLGGEIAYEVDSFTPPNPAWKVILRVNEPELLQTALNSLFTATHLTTQRSEDGGLVYHTFLVPSAQKATEITYVFADGYLILASSREGAAEAVRLHRSGESLAKSESFRASLPPGHSSDASFLFYEDPSAMAAMSMRQASPQIAEFFSQTLMRKSPVSVCAYGEETAIREASRSSGVDAGAVLVVAAIAIPNLMRARMAANESSAVASVHTVNIAQVMYTNTYPERGYARDLASLGPDPAGSKTFSAAHAGVIDEVLGNATCIAGAWCTKAGYQFALATGCKKQKCEAYAVVATPVSTSTGTRSFCSTSDGVVRFKLGPPLTTPIGATECLAWQPVR